MSAKTKLPRFPPRKARTSIRLINVVGTLLTNYFPFGEILPKRTTYTLSSLCQLLVLTSVLRTSMSQKARDVRERLPGIPSGESVLRWFRRRSLETLEAHQNQMTRQFLDSLPPPFQQVRKKGMSLVIDIHSDPSYSKKKSEYIDKGQKKASSKRNWKYISVIWSNAPEPITLAVNLMKRPYQVYPTARAILEPWLTTACVTELLADGEFYVWDLVSWLKMYPLDFTIRSRLTDPAKHLARRHRDKLTRPGMGIVLPYSIIRPNTEELCPVQLVLWRTKKELRSYIIPPNSSRTARQTHTRYRRRFIIETYYRMMHRFQPFSCSQHPTVRYMLVCLAFWMCNCWNYFKYPITLLKRPKKRIRADKVYTANMFCESVVESWHVSIH